MAEYAIRYDDPGQDIHDQIVLFLKEKAEVYAYCRELGGTGENPHFHWYIATSASIKSIRNKFNRLGIKGNAGYSCTQVKNTLKCVGYIVKQNLIEHNICDDYMADAYVYDSQVKEDLKEIKKSAKEKKSYQKQLFADTLQHYQSLDWNFEEIKPMYLRIDVMTRLVDGIIDQDLLVRRFDIVQKTDTICCKLSQKYKQALIEDMAGCCSELGRPANK